MPHKVDMVSCHVASTDAVSVAAALLRVAVGVVCVVVALNNNNHNK